MLQLLSEALPAPGWIKKWITWKLAKYKICPQLYFITIISDVVQGNIFNDTRYFMK